MPTWPPETKAYALEQKRESFWTPERIVLITELRTVQHKSSGEIAKIVGNTRNAVIGKLARMGIMSPNRASHPYIRKPRPLHKPMKPSKPKTLAIAPWSRLAPRKGIQPPKNPEGPSRKAVGSGKGILLVKLGPQQCKWSIGYSAKGEHLFCGAAQHENTPYCAEHHKRSIREQQ